MDAAPVSPEPLLVVQQPEVLEELQQAQLGPLPRLAAICRLKRLPSGGYSTTDDLHLVLERRRVANAKERERVRGRGHLTPAIAIVLAGVPHPAPAQSLAALRVDFASARLDPGPQGPACSCTVTGRGSGYLTC